MNRLRSRRAAPPDLTRPSAVVPRRGWLLADAMAHRSGIDEAATDFGRAAAQDGEGLDVCLAELDETHLAVDGDVAPPLLVRRVALAWADAVQERYNGLTCADPTTGLSSIQHVQSEVAALYRAAGNGWLVDTDIARTHALAVIELTGIRDDVDDGFGRLEAALRRATAAELVRDGLPATNQVAELNPRRLVALVARTADLDARLADVLDTLGKRLQLSPSGGRCRGWTEALPLGPDAARALLDELAR